MLGCLKTLSVDQKRNLKLKTPNLDEMITHFMPEKLVKENL